MSFSQIITDRVLPVVVAATTLSVIGVTGLFVSKGHIGGAISTGVLAMLFGIVVVHDVKRLLLKK